MKIEKFEDLISWQKAREVSLLVYKIFRTNKDFSFRDQLQRAVVSISNNIAEGFERKSNKELMQFLYIAKGSCGESRSMLYLAKDLSYISKEEFNILINLLVEISRLLSGFIKTL
ncbi:MAG TPA: four helix bundle protein [Candidatus Paceibacterota bacterium]